MHCSSWFLKVFGSHTCHLLSPQTSYYKSNNNWNRTHNIDWRRETLKHQKLLERLTMASVVAGEEVRNKQVILKDYVSGFPKESDMQVINGTIKLKLQEGSHGIVVKNLYLSCDPYMRSRMTRVEGPNVFTSYTPGSVSTLSLLSWFYFLYVRNHCRHMDNNFCC